MNCPYSEAKGSKMHELSMAQNILDICLSEFKRHKASKIVEIVVKIGQFTCIQSDNLIFSFEIIRGGTPADEAELTVEKIEITADNQTSSGQEFYVDHMKVE